MLATGGDDNMIRVFSLDVKDYKSSKMVFELSGHYESINALDFSPD